ncbi:MAG: tetratricopeptide repeat protein, partial [Gemmatimonadota bacterium]
HRSDMYSLASVLYEMLAGETPYTGATAQALIVKRMIDPVPSIRRIRESVSQQVDTTISRALAKAPADRFASMVAFAQALVTNSGTVASPLTAKTADGIVILPFVNSSPDPENEYFSDGLTEELIADLAQVRALRVISRTSSMQLKGTTKGVRAIGVELGVRYVLEGSVRKAGNALRITAQLIDAMSDAQLWSEKYSGTMDDVFDVQERVSRAIVEALNVKLSPQEEVGLADRPIANVRAFELYLQARQEIGRYGVERGMALLNAAIQIEGLTPPLQSLAAWAKVVSVRSGMSRNPRQELGEAEATAQSLLIQAPDAPQGHTTLGLIGYERGQLADAVRHFRAALERAPNDADALLHLGVAYIGAGQNEAAADTARRFLACDPLSPVAWMLDGIPAWFTGYPADGVSSMTKAVEMDPESIIGRWSLAYNMALVGRVDEAMTHAEVMAANAPEMPYTVQILALVEALSGHKEGALERLANVVGLDGHHKFHLAESFAMAGATDRALDLLEQAVNQGFHPYPFIAEHCPFLVPLRGTPRFVAIAARAERLTAEFRA